MNGYLQSVSETWWTAVGQGGEETCDELGSHLGVCQYSYSLHNMENGISCCTTRLKYGLWLLAPPKKKSWVQLLWCIVTIPRPETQLWDAKIVYASYICEDWTDMLISLHLQRHKSYTGMLWNISEVASVPKYRWVIVRIQDLYFHDGCIVSRVKWI